MLSRSDPFAFSRVLVVLPDAKRAGPSDVHLAVRDLSLDSRRSGKAKESDPLQITLRSFVSVRCRTKPSYYFFSGDNQKHPAEALVASDVIVAGWIVHSLDRGGNDDQSTEDVHFGLWLDPDFIVRNYAFVHVLDGAIIPGRPFNEWDHIIHDYVHIPLTGGGPVTAGTFLMPGLEDLNIEQNAWHVSRRGTPPAGWARDLSTNLDGTPKFRDDRYAQVLALPPDDWAFHEGDYVEITGALIEDSGHLHFASGQPVTAAEWTHQCWDQVSKGNAGWLELHPFDAMQKARPPLLRKHLQVVQLCRFKDGSGPLGSEINTYLSATPEKPPTPSSVLRFEELVDPRFSDMTKVTDHTVEVSPCDPPRLHVHAKLALGGHFMATYKLWWEDGDQPRPAPPASCSSPPVPNPNPKPKPKLTDEAACKNKPSLPQCNRN
ncbi:MAG: hypothetical protein E6J90_06150 [Deltaproteobacteria bacterium]|nr:MAG: hypothetical protein E6J91_40710 [Deltaproteobacteria bacterium]TMQ25387.1 MAG: hypothetical protein E6J90_06150 [Deltaproteobacteria bacterium]